MAETAENWDLHAVVRSCSSSAIDATTISSARNGEESSTGTILDGNSVAEIINNNNPLSFLSSLKFEDEEDPFCFPTLLQEERNNGLEELQDSYKPFFPTNIGRDDIILRSSSSSGCALGGLTSQQHHQQQLTTSISTSTSTDSPLTPTSSTPIFVFGEPKSQRSRQVQQQPQRIQQDLQLQQQQPGPRNCPRPMQSQAPARSRKRKTPQKRMVCHVTAENLSADLWAWRKYGQKPIKGSPYPRNYYRCSSSKGCAARKQVERSCADPNIFIVSYTGDHTHPRPTHRNSLAGSSRNKFSRAQNSPSKDNSTSAPRNVAKASCSSPLSSSSHSLTAAEEEKNSSVENSQLQGAGDMDSDMVTEEFDDEDELLIPNLAAAMNEDLFKGFDATSTSNSI